MINNLVEQLKAAELEVAKLKKQIENEKYKQVIDMVESWPKWKQNILAHSASPTVSTPRKPITYDV